MVAVHEDVIAAPEDFIVASPKPSPKPSPTPSPGKAETTEASVAPVVKAVKAVTVPAVALAADAAVPPSLEKVAPAVAAAEAARTRRRLEESERRRASETSVLDEALAKSLERTAALERRLEEVRGGLRAGERERAECTHMHAHVLHTWTCMYTHMDMYTHMSPPHARAYTYTCLTGRRLARPCVPRAGARWLVGGASVRAAGSGGGRPRLVTAARGRSRGACGERGGSAR